ncbi:sugar transferase [Paenibacillus contaminans]|uniref:Sugar transferase n=1 Tax=Paenibacillus contaminans TaxID=450362 RepID=A0A329MQC6_9BACL|nr:sugar transferase [Paenibacillus contaminans]RAV21638.1 sugar transferase [Paenibacillus contaminans]
MAAKRIFDFVFALLGIAVISPLLIVVSLWIKLDSSGPVFFKQKRVGRNGNAFQIYKFRTMVKDAEKLGKQITVGKDPRISRAGMFLRKLKLDELPQLFNVLKGDMSFVGPRPEVPHYVSFYTKEQQMVLSVLPGITDYASLKYIDENLVLSASKDPEYTYVHQVMADKIKINLEYLQRMSLWEDIKIIILTIFRVVWRKKETETNENTHARSY